MHITELRLVGFKSFVDPARAPIEPGLTGVVGPNGCGKSNLLEAVRWVMGATSAKSMRAADMEDVIFSGNAGRPAREHAEVTIALADALGRAPAPFHKEDALEITRRIRRGLGSTYRINGKEVRAKDVQLLFADAATGANSPALVRQGQISELIAAKAQNRRRILEDAAGIAGLHARRHEADLKLRAAETNLARIDEVLAEIEGQAQSLKKQARQAERYRGLAQTLRETEALLLHRRWNEAREKEAEARAHLRDAERAAADAAKAASAAVREAEDAHEVLPPLREAEMVAAAVLRRYEGTRVGLERDLAEAEAVVARCDADTQRARDEAERLDPLKTDAELSLTRLAAEAAALGADDGPKAQAKLEEAQEAAKTSADFRAAAEAKLEALAAEAAARRARAQALADAAGDAKARLVRSEERQRSTNAQLAALPALSQAQTRAAKASADADAARNRHEERASALSAAEAALKQAHAAEETAWTPHRAAEDAARNLEAEVRALRQLAPAQAKKFPPVLDAIEVAPGFERALAAALGDEIEASTVAEAPARWSGARTPPPTLPAEAQSIVRFVKAPEALAARLALVGVVDAKDGARLAAALTPGARLVSKDGDLWRWDGFVRRADAPLAAAVRLEHKNRLAAAEKELKTAQEQASRAKKTWEQARATRIEHETKARALRADFAASANEAAEASRAAQSAEVETQRALERRKELESQAEALSTDIVNARSALAATSPASAPEAADDAAIHAAREAVSAARAAAADAAATMQSLARERAQRSARRQAIDTEVAQWRARAESASARLAALSRELDDLAARRDAALAAPVAARAKLEALMQEAALAEGRRAEAGDALAQAEAEARRCNEAQRALEQAHAAAREVRAGADAHAAAAAARVADIVAHAQEQAGRAPEDLANLAGALISGPLASAPIAEVERRLERLKAERDAAGPVNLRAEEELAEAQERVATLSKEKDDVAQGITKLRRAITTLNNEGRARLLRAFEEVDAHFAQLFATLFGGGQANLKLTESEDPLEAGLEIFAEPPGKRLTNLSLLSGGEQALTATALIFAVFLANPAPLCVLDEVDAPLDDSNVDRFCRMLEEMKRLTSTRFLVITHNPVTMSRMDRLYGVTMPEQGVSQLVSVDLVRAQAMAAE